MKTILLLVLFIPLHAMSVSSATYVVNWKGKSWSEIGGTTVQKTTYDIRSSIHQEISTEGRFKKIQAALKYVSPFDPVDSSYDLYGTLIYNPVPTRKIKVYGRSGSLEGTAFYSDKNGSLQYDFENSIKQLGVNIFDKNVYLGLRYTQLDLPSGIALKDQYGSLVYTGFDEGLSSEIITFVAGIDTSNIPDKEVSKLFVDYELGIGLGRLNVSESLGDVDYRYLSIENELRVGYMYRSEYGFMTGTVQIGLRGVLWITSDFGKQTVNSSSLQLVYNRNDLLYGPFVKVVLSF